MKIGQFTTHLTGVGLIRKLHHTQSGGSRQHITIGAFEETCGITATLLTLQIGHRHIIKGTTVPSLQGTIHTEIEQAVTVLHKGVHVIARQGLVGIVLTTDDSELITVVTVDAITGGGPQETFTINIYLRDKTTGKLFVRIEKLPHLSIRTRG